MTSKNDIKDVFYSYTSDPENAKDENALLRKTVEHMKNELLKYKEPPLMICEINEMHDNQAVIKIPNGNQFMVNISENCDKIRAGDTVLVEQKNLTVIQKIGANKRFNVEQFVIMEKPTTKWSEVGGLDSQIRDIQEVVELPLKRPELFKKVGIQPPKGILLYGPPGTGKTILAKAVAASTGSTFIQVVGSELVQKFIGEGAKLVKEVFQLAKEKAPSIVFIDEIDALAGTRMEMGTSGEREVQRTFMQLLAELDGFKPLGNVKVIGATNRKDILDPAVLRPGRLDRLIHVGNPDEKGLIEIFKIHSKNMTLDKHFDTSKLVKKMKDFSGAEVKAVCTEAGYFAIRKLSEKKRNNQIVNLHNDIETCNKEIESIKKEKKGIEKKLDDFKSLPLYKKMIKELQSKGKISLNKDVKKLNKLVAGTEKNIKEKTTSLDLLENKKYKLIEDEKKTLLVTKENFFDAVKKVKQKEEELGDGYLHMFG